MVDECGQVSHELNMRVISLVPSWTETLIACDVNVVGRTRFCIHPEVANAIPVVGGTKDLDWKKVRELRPDLLLVDREENLEWMKREAPCSVVDTHVSCLADVVRDLQILAKVSDGGQSAKLRVLADRWQKVIAAPSQVWSWGKIPGEIERLLPSSQPFSGIAYVIWKNPWMTVGRQTFIGDVLAKLGAEVAVGASGLQSASEKYPQHASLAEFPSGTYFLFSSEPFPFHKKMDELRALGLHGSIVDGECYSWFGLRSLIFLEQELGL